MDITIYTKNTDCMGHLLEQNNWLKIWFGCQRGFWRK